MTLKKFKEEIGHKKTPKWPICSNCVHFSMTRAFGIDSELRCNLGKPFKTGKTCTCNNHEYRYDK